ncbi:MAG: rhodanese-like domain-containing protein [Myxococcaceae bacterium]|nr:rhodanese-like domain-containing protein [Myxococcaceae bacterium]
MTLPRELGVLELKAWLDDASRAPPVLLDVRNHDEWQWVRLAGATFIPLGELEERHDELLPLKERPIVVYCHHGVRSLYGSEYLRELGYDTTSLRGGIDAWSLHVDPAIARY